MGYFTSYRDPNLKGTYDVYDGAVDFVRNFDVDERTMTKYIIGAISGLDTPLTPSAKGDQSFLAYLTDMTDERKQRERDEVLATNVDAIRALAPIVESVLKTGARACLGNEEEVRACADMFDKLVKLK
jgi:Zn-dependent M16 (insulinase) family peptidase